MSVTINAASADIDIAAGNAKSDATPGRNIVVFHLTKGFDLSQVEDHGAEPGPAFEAFGHVKVAVSGGNPLAGWEFGFIQIVQMHTGQAFYAGRKRSEGSISVMFERAMPNLVLLDSRDDRSPWTVKSSRFTLDRGEITCPTSDHPALKVPRKLRNSGRNIDNFLFHVLADLEFWSVMTAIDPGGKKQQLANFHWQVSHNVQFVWRNGDPQAATKKSAFTVHGKAKGAPTDSTPGSLLQSPAPPQFNTAVETAMKQAFLGARGPNRTENDSWFANVPLDFFN